MSSKRLVSLLLLAALLASCSGRSPGDQAANPLPVTGLLDEVQGTVELRDLGQADFGAAANGAGLQVGGQVRTGADGRARLNLSSGSMIRVGPNSLFQFQSNQPVQGGLLTHLILQSGQVWISLHGGGVDVETPSGVASVRGSYMKISVDPLTRDVWVNCIEGLCQTQSPAGTIDLVSGQGSLLYAWDAAAGVGPMTPSLYPLSQQEVAEFVTVNPECQPVVATANATASALPQTPQFTPTPVLDCFQLTAPSNGATLPADDPVTFTWTDQPGRYKYVLTFTKPSGGQVALIAWTNSYTKDMSLLPEGGTYQWSVTAYDARIRPICTSGPFTFTKPESSEAPATLTPGAPGSCVTLTAPADGASLPASGVVDFAWTEYTGRYKFIINIVKPDGSTFSEIAWANSFQKDLGLLTAGGTYRWSVTVYDAQIQPICTSAAFTFTKPESAPVSGGDCVTLLSPVDGAELPVSGPVDFTWTEYPGAYKYIITFFPPNTPAVSFLAWTPSHTRYMESFPDSGAYQWTITVKDADIQDICTAGPFTFTKSAGAPLPTVKPGDPQAPPTGSTPGSGDLFWDRMGPGGAQTSCSSLYFGVSTSVNGMIKVIYTNGGTPDGYNHPHAVIGNGPGSGSGTLDFSGYPGQTIYYRFGVYNGGVYTHDGSVFSFTCP